jgi:uncharacterized protein YjbI with pentapeptide repeats
MISILSLFTASFAFLLYLNLYEKGIEGRNEYFSNLAVELGGIAYELFVVGIAFAWYERRQKRIENEKSRIALEEKERKSQIRELRDRIAMYIPLKNDHSKVQIFQAIERLNELGVKDINLTNADLTVIDVSKEDNVIRKILLQKGTFSSAKFDGVNLNESEFIDCVASGFYFEDNTPINSSRGMFMRNVIFDDSSLQNGSFRGAYLNGASFARVSFSGEMNFEKADLRNVDFSEATGRSFHWHQARVGETFLSDLQSWNIDSEAFFSGVVLLWFREIIPRRGIRTDIRSVFLLVEVGRYKSLSDLLYRENPFRYVLIDSGKLSWIDPASNKEDE